MGAPANCSITAASPSIPALWVFVCAYIVFGVMTWFFYLRAPATAKASSLAGASI